jgi:hypothetical protein
MLLDWPEQKRELGHELERAMRSLSRRGLVAEVRALTFYEGDRALLIHPSGHTQELTLKTIEAKVTLDRQALAEAPELLADAVRKLAGGIGDQMEKDLIQLMQKVDPRHGGVVHAGEDDEATFHDLMRGLREMDMSFEEDGRPSIVFVAHPDNVLKLQVLNTPERQRLFDELIAEKRNEWLRRESYRRLAD